MQRGSRHRLAVFRTLVWTKGHELRSPSSCVRRLRCFTEAAWAVFFPHAPPFVGHTLISTPSPKALSGPSMKPLVLWDSPSVSLFLSSGLLSESNSTSQCGEWRCPQPRPGSHRECWWLRKPDATDLSRGDSHRLQPAAARWAQIQLVF